MMGHTPKYLKEAHICVRRSRDLFYLFVTPLDLDLPVNDLLYIYNKYNRSNYNINHSCRSKLNLHVVYNMMMIPLD